MITNLSNLFGKILEPFALCLLLVIFFIPVITVINLQPTTQKGELTYSNVLGTSSQSTGQPGEITITLMDEESRGIFSDNSLQLLDNKQLEYSVVIGVRDSGIFSNPSFEINNQTDSTRTIEISGQTDTNINSNIYILIGDNSYKIQDSNGNTYTQEVDINKGERVTAYLSVDNKNPVQFAEKLNIYLRQI